MVETTHIDSFTSDHLPPRDQWPEFRFALPELQYPEEMNVATVLLDGSIEAGYGDKVAVIAADHEWTYYELATQVDRIARVLTEDLGMVTGNRVLIRGFNNAKHIAIWLAIVKAGGVVVDSMPLLRERELRKYIAKARINLALCDYRLINELAPLMKGDSTIERVVCFGESELEAYMAEKPGSFKAARTLAEDVALLSFTSGTTGEPKATVHFHRDVLAMADTVARHVLKPDPDDVFTGSPPFAFTFGLGALVIFPLRFGCTTLLIEQPSPEALLDAIEHGATMMFTAPTMYRALLSQVGGRDLKRLRKCVSAGEHLPKATWEAWHEKTGIQIIDGIGATEMIHIFISAAEGEIRPGATGKVVPGYEACVLGEDFKPLPLGNTGRLAVRGPTGCRYLDDTARQANYVVNGWNVTGDIYRTDRDGYFWFVARADDMIVSSGYNIGGPEVEEALMRHPAVRECAVIGVPDTARGMVVKAVIVPTPGVKTDDQLVKQIQDFVKDEIAPYKYPRIIEFVETLPKTQTGKIRRFELRE